MVVGLEKGRGGIKDYSGRGKRMEKSGIERKSGADGGGVVGR